MIIYAKSGTTIHIGRVGENLATTVVFDISNWKKEFQNGTAQLIINKDGENYYQIVSQKVANEKTEIHWVVTNSNTQHAGMGKCELIYTSNDVVVKSAIYDFIVTNALASEEGAEPPDAFKSWFEDIGTKANEATTSALEAEGWARGKQNGVDVTSESKYYLKNAEHYKNRAKQWAIGEYVDTDKTPNKTRNSLYFAEQSEKWATGQLDKEDVGSTEEQYENNAKYYANKAGKSAETAAGSVTSASGSAEAAAKSAKAAKDSADAAENSASAAAGSASSASGSAEAAGNSASAASQSESNAWTSEQAAAQSAKAAKDSADAAKTAQTAVEEIALYPPRIGLKEEGENPNYWYIWNKENKKYINSGVKALFSIVAVYESEDAMQNSTTHEVGDFVIVSSALDDKVAVLWVYNGTVWTKVTDLTGYEGVGISTIDGPIMISNDGGVDTYTIHLTNGEKYEFKVQSGIDGNSIKEIVPSESNTGESGTKDKYTINFTKTPSVEYTVYNGKDGNSIVKVIPSEDNTGNADTKDKYTIEFTETEPFEFEVYNGKDGNTITSLTRVSGNGAPGTYDTYKIEFSAADPIEYTVYNGIDGISPIINTQATPTGHKVTFVDKDGEKSIELFNGDGAGDMVSNTYDKDGVVAAAGGIDKYATRVTLKTWTIEDIK